MKRVISTFHLVVVSAGVGRDGESAGEKRVWGGEESVGGRVIGFGAGKYIN